MSIDSDLIRGNVDTIILRTLTSGDKYGYEIIKDIEIKSGGTYELKQPTLYSCLKRLDTQGLIDSYWLNSDIGGKRHYYKLTDEGKAFLDRSMDEWLSSRAIIDNLISGNLAGKTTGSSSRILLPDEDVSDANLSAVVSEDPMVYEDDNEATAKLQADEENNELDTNAAETKPANSADVLDGQMSFDQTEVVPSSQSAQTNIDVDAEPNMDEYSSSVDPESLDIVSEYYNVDENQINLFDNIAGNAETETSEEQSNATEVTLQQNDEPEEIVTAASETPTSENKEAQEPTSQPKTDNTTFVSASTLGEVDYLSTTSNEQDENFEKLSEQPALDEDLPFNDEEIEVVDLDADGEERPQTMAGAPTFAYNTEDIEEIDLDAEDGNPDHKSYLTEEENEEFKELTEAQIGEEMDASFEKYDEGKCVEHKDLSSIPPYLVEDYNPEHKFGTVADNDAEERFNLENFFENNDSSYSAAAKNDEAYLEDKDYTTIKKAENNLNLLGESVETDEPEEIDPEFSQDSEATEDEKLFSVNYDDEDDDTYHSTFNNNNFSAEDDTSEPEGSAMAQEQKSECVKDVTDTIEQIATDTKKDNAELSDKVENYRLYTPRFTESEYRELLDNLDNLGAVNTNQNTKPVNYFEGDGNFENLTSKLNSEGVSVRPYIRPEPEPVELKKYLLVNKIKMISSWIVFLFMSGLLALTYLICSKVGYLNFKYLSSALPAYVYFLFAFAFLLAIPLIYTLIYVINPTKKAISKYSPNISLIFAILFFVQCLVIIYAINLPFGFYSFKQLDYNHLYWVLPSVCALTIILSSVVYTMLFKSKRYNV